jgi:hypothetical protein
MSSADVPLLLQWNQPDGSAPTDLAVLVFSGGSYLGGVTDTTNQQLGAGYPEIDIGPAAGIDLPAGTYQIAIEVISGPNPGVIEEDLYTDNGDIGGSISDANAGTVFWPSHVAGCDHGRRGGCGKHSRQRQRHCPAK